MKTNCSKIIVVLNNIIADNPNSIEKQVAQIALEYHCPRNFFEDLNSHGCISGMVSELIYYSDTHDFYDKHYYQIESLRKEYSFSFLDKEDTKNCLAWFAFEVVANQLYNKIAEES